METWASHRGRHPVRRRVDPDPWLVLESQKSMSVLGWVCASWSGGPVETWASHRGQHPVRRRVDPDQWLALESQESVLMLSWGREPLSGGHVELWALRVSLGGGPVEICASHSGTGNPTVNGVFTEIMRMCAT